MATDATGTPTTHFSIPTYNVDVDSPSGLGFNAAMAAIDTAMNGLMASPSTPGAGDVPVWNGSAWVKSSGAQKVNVSALNITGTPTGAKFLRDDASWQIPNAGAIYQQKTTAKLVANTTETDLLNNEITIAANPGVNALMRLTTSGDNLGNNGIQTSPRFKVKFGGTTILDTNTLAAAWGASATRSGWRAVVEIQNLGVANAQFVSFKLDFGFAAVNTAGFTAFTTGSGNIALPSNAGIMSAQGVATAAQDTTTSKLLELAVTLPSAVSTECKLFDAKLEILP